MDYKPTRSPDPVEPIRTPKGWPKGQPSVGTKRRKTYTPPQPKKWTPPATEPTAPPVVPSEAGKAKPKE